MQLLKPGYVMEKNHAKKKSQTTTAFSSTGDEWKSAITMEKAVRKTTTAKARNLTENVKFDECCISGLFPQSLLSSWLPCAKQGAGHS